MAAVSRILKYQLFLLSLLAFIAFIAFYYQAELPDNYLAISSNSNEMSSFTYYTSSILAWFDYFTGPWLLFPFITFGVLYAFVFAARSAWYDLFHVISVSIFYLVFFYFFVPEFLGRGMRFLLADNIDTLTLSMIGVIAFCVFAYGSFKGIISFNIFKIARWFGAGSSRLISFFSNTLIAPVGSVSKRVLSQRRLKKIAENPSTHAEKKSFNLANAYGTQTEANAKPEDIVLTDSKINNINKENSIYSQDQEKEAPRSAESSGKRESFKNNNSNSNPLERPSTHKKTSDDQKYYSLVATLSSAQSALKVEHPDNQYFEDIINRIEEKLSEFRIDGHIINVLKGPVVDTFELELGSGVKVSKVTRSAEDLSLALYGAPIRIVYPMLGRTTVGIEVPRNPRELIYLNEVLNTKEFESNAYQLPLAMGKNAFGEIFIVDLASMPHMLVAGATGAGKSVFINSLLVSLLVKRSPNQMKLILIDPKQLELALYAKLPHLVMPVITEAKMASIALLWACQEMEKRYSILKELGVRNINGFNDKVKNASPETLAKIHQYYDDQGDNGYELPYLVIIVDEFADLILTKAGKEIENNICRLAAKARAAGIHLVLATQRPSVDVITGLIKSNFPTRVSFRVTSSVDSRTILNTVGAEKLLGKGDMLYKHGTSSYRVHSSFVSEDEIEALTEKLSEMDCEFDSHAMDFLENGGEESSADPYAYGSHIASFGGDSDGNDDEIFREAVKVVIEHRTASASMLQRRLRIGYNRAANIIEQMESKGIVGPAEGSKRRKVLVAGPDL